MHISYNFSRHDSRFVLVYCNFPFDVLFAVNGGFTAWSTWGTCSKGCGDGTQVRTRTCTNPPPANGGSTCQGGTSQTRQCKIKECPGKTCIFSANNFLHEFF